jgi:hypothetical protein
MGIAGIVLAIASQALAALSTERSQGAVTVRGGHFALTIDLGRGGEIGLLKLHDGAQWNTVFSGPATTFPMVRLAEKAGLYALAGDAKAELISLSESPEKIEIKVRGVPRGADGVASPWKVTLGYEIYAEGAVFIDLEYRLDEKPFTLTAASLGFAVDQRIRKAAKYSQEHKAKETPGFRSARVAFGVNPVQSYTNEIEVVAEYRIPMAGRTVFTPKDGRFVWTLGQGEQVLAPPYRYHNRISLGLGAAMTGRPRTRAVGQRIFHWINWIDTAKWYPTNAQIDKMAALNATMLVLHHEWMLQRGSNGYPHADYAVVRDRDEVVRCIEHAHAKGLRVGLYMRGVEWYGLDTGFFQKYCKRDWDGIYVDWHGSCAVSWHDGRYKPENKLGDAHQSKDGTYVPAREYFLFTRRLRQTVGAEGFLIGHQGSFNSGILANLLFDAYLPGETGSDHAMFAGCDKAIYKGMMGGVTCMPWTLDSPVFLTPEGVAKMAAWGFYPHIGLGLQPPRSKRLFPVEPDDPLYANFLPYWRVLSRIDAEKAAVYNLPSVNQVAVVSSNPDVQALVYKADRAYLVIVANLGPKPAHADLTLQAKVLGMEGTYKVWRIDSASGQASPCGETTGRLTTSELPQWGIEGFRLEPR